MGEEIVKHLNISEKGARYSFRIGIALFIISFIILGIGVEKYNISLNGDNLMFIVAGLFFSGLVLIIVPMYFGIKNRELDIKEENILEKNELLTEIKKYFNKKNINGVIDFNIVRKKGIYKTLIKKDNLELRIWLDENDKEGDYGRFYIWSEDYKKLNKEINDNFKELSGWDYGRPYIDKLGGVENIKTQLDNIIEIIK